MKKVIFVAKNWEKFILSEIFKIVKNSVTPHPYNGTSQIIFKLFMHFHIVKRCTITCKKKESD